MQIIVIGPQALFEDFSKKAGEGHELIHLVNARAYAGKEPVDVAVDFTIEDSVDHLFDLLDHIQAGIYLVNSVKTSLHELAYLVGGLPENVIGFNGLPGFINRDTWEVTALSDEFLEKLPFEYVRVDDRVGMVTPRVLCMIINEAYYTVQEGTASREDIDMGMKLGTGYPYGPFEWAERIGINHVYELLEALYSDTREERYKICPLLRKEYLELY
ncbi:MAG: 3-hydroxyacyl-CoA dehydrogenase family protein [Cyclobacteriaceae bacterium]